MQVFIYRSRRRPDSYLYLAERDGLDPVPEALRAQLEPLEFSFEFNLDQKRQLAVEDAARVRHNLTELGFHLQAPRDPTRVDDG